MLFDADGKLYMLQTGTSDQANSFLSGKKIIVDLTPLLPGGGNGGAKFMTLALISALARLLPETHFVLLTAKSSHGELAQLETEHPNIQRTCILHTIPTAEPANLVSALIGGLRERLKALAFRLIPSGLAPSLKALKSAIAALIHRLKALAGGRLAPNPDSLSRQLGAHLLFCPFTAPFYADARVPTVAVIYDLQHRVYPQFFAPEDVLERESNFQMACQKAQVLVAISEFVRQTVVEEAAFSLERVVAIPIGLLRTPDHSTHPGTERELLESYGVRQGEYLLYPANFWKHKNHAMLLTAFQLYREANAVSPLKLLCTGAPGKEAEAFCEAAQRMGLAEWVIYPGYVTSEQYDALLSSAFAMVFPSLYEGFGMPVLEAMAARVPVLCSNVTSLPEVGGDAVLYFDPRRPHQIVDCLVRLSKEPGLRTQKIAQGLQRSRLFLDPNQMALRYADVFVNALTNGVGDTATRDTALRMENQVGT
jgi:glycosyltransferase involved in cell wall biosynthesis